MASVHPRTIHDFYGFPAPLYEVQYPAPGAPDEAAKLASDPEIVPDNKWGLDHGSWSVLRHMYPKADVPAFQLSLNERRDLKGHLELGREIQSLRERGVLILGSGNIVHNLRRIDWNNLHAHTTGRWNSMHELSMRSMLTTRRRWRNHRSGATPC